MGETVLAKATGNSLVPLDTLGGLAKASIAAGDKSLDKAEQHYKSAGLYLSEAKERVARTKNLTWPAYLIQHCPIGRRQADLYIEMAEGRTSLAEVREGYKERNAKRGNGRVHTQSPENHQQEQPDDEAEADGNDNSESEIAAPEQIEDNILHVIGGMNENARVFNKLLKVSAFDSEAVTRVNTAIDRMIGKWRSIQSTLGKKVASVTEPDDDDDPTADADHKQGLRVIAARGFLNRAKEAKEICTIEKLQASDVTDAMIKAADDAGAVWTATAHNLRRMATPDTVAAKAKPAPKKLPPDELAARRKRKRKADDKTVTDYFTQFGDIGGCGVSMNRDAMQRMEASLKSGVDDFAEMKAERDRKHTEYVREETLKRAALNEPLLAPITPKKEQAYTRLIKTRTLYEGACGLSWQEYFEYREADSECEPLTRGDLDYAHQWTACAIVPEMDAGTATEKTLRELAARHGYKVRRRGTEYNLCGEDDSRLGGSLEGVISWFDLITPTSNEQEALAA